jgi:hypothetical protein
MPLLLCEAALLALLTLAKLLQLLLPPPLLPRPLKQRQMLLLQRQMLLLRLLRQALNCLRTLLSRQPSMRMLQGSAVSPLLRTTRWFRIVRLFPPHLPLQLRV